MAPQHQEHEHWRELLPILDDHTEWFHALVQYLFYPETAENTGIVQKPTSFAQWFVYANVQDDIAPEIVEKLGALHADLFKLSDVLLQFRNEKKEKPSQKNFKMFLTVYEEFLISIRRLEKDFLLEGSGYDSFTGLRSKNLLFVDIERELQRLNRQGKNFCLALVKVDNFDVIKENAKKEEMDGYVKLVADLIKLSLRSFDDAYYMGGDEFLLSLKQADISGGMSALERLRKELEHQGIKLCPKNSDNLEEMSLTLSCCIAEPVFGDDVKELIANLQNDLRAVPTKKTDAVLEYHELSPLQRYVQDKA